MKNLFLLLSFAGVTIAMSSCISYWYDHLSPKPEYIGEKPASVIPYETAGKPSQLLPVDPYELPPSAEFVVRQVKYSADQIPYGFESDYRNCVHSPYYPFRRLDMTGLHSGQKVMDPYDGKVFYLP